jgi:poly(3-hydroxybutyrate) depolymerase
MRLILTAALCLLSSNAFAAATCSSVTLGWRSYTLCAPSSPQNPAPLVVSLHPGLSYSGDGTTTGWSGLSSQLDGALTDQAETDGFYVVYPDGWGRVGTALTWNAKQQGCCGYSKETRQKDGELIERIIADVEASYTIDSNNIVFASYSNGGMMSMTFACNHPAQVAGMVIVAGPMLTDADSCQSLTGIPITYIHGSADTTVPPAGGVGDADSYSFPATSDMLATLTSLGATVTEYNLTGATHTFADAKSYLSSQESLTFEGIVSDMVNP